MLSVKAVLVLVAVTLLVLFQQSYANSHRYSCEQPVGLLGTADYFFRHPEALVKLFGLFLRWMFKAVFRV